MPNAECWLLLFSRALFPLIPGQNFRLRPRPVFSLEAILAAAFHIKFIGALADFLFYPRMRLCRRGMGGADGSRSRLRTTRLDRDGTRLGRGWRRLPGALGLPRGAISCSFIGHG